jgi:hypothetical protein
LTLRDGTSVLIRRLAAEDVAIYPESAALIPTSPKRETRTSSLRGPKPSAIAITARSQGGLAKRRLSEAPFDEIANAVCSKTGAGDKR